MFRSFILVGLLLKCMIKISGLLLTFVHLFQIFTKGMEFNIFNNKIKK